MSNAQYIHFGCGLSAPTTWRNFDISPTMRLQRLPAIGRLLQKKRFPTFPENIEYGDITRGLPVPPNSCKAIYCSHVLEHLALDDLRGSLRHIHRYLAPGGIFRLVLPDLEQLAQDYLTSSAPNANSQFMLATGLGRTSRSHRPEQLAREWFGGSHHDWLWDEKGLTAELTAAGFLDIRRATIGDSTELRFADVEDQGRWGHATLGMECHK